MLLSFPEFCDLLLEFSVCVVVPEFVLVLLPEFEFDGFEGGGVLTIGVLPVSVFLPFPEFLNDSISSELFCICVELSGEYRRSYHHG